MSGGFSFPPPPPPPRKVPQQEPHFDSEDRGRGRGRGALRGEHNQRGRGQFNSREGHQANGIPRQYTGHHNTAWQSNSAQSTLDKTPSHAAFAKSHQSHQQFRSQPLLSGHHVNPNFGSSTVGYNANPSGSGTYNAVNYLDSNGSADSSSISKAGSLPRTAAGHKRKLDALRGPRQEKKPAPQTAPAVPSFGAPILPPKALSSTSPSNEGRADQPKPKPKPKPKTVAKALGLTPAAGDLQYSSSDSDADDREVDEESMFAELGNKLTFEHNGVVMSLHSEADLAAWRKERQRNWPTQARMAERLEERRRIGEERKRLLASADTLRKPQRSSSNSKTRSGNGLGSKARDSHVSHTVNHQNSDIAAKPESELERSKREMLEQSRKLDELRRKVSASEVRNREAQARARERQANETTATSDNMAEGLIDQKQNPSSEVGHSLEPDAKAENVGEDLSATADTGPSDASSVVSSDSSPESESESDDGPPEEVDSKPPAKTVQGDQLQVCRYFAASGYCPDREACKFRHEWAPKRPNVVVQIRQTQQTRPQRNTYTQPRMPEGTNRRRSVFQRLMEQEQDEEDRLALQVIKYLGKGGLFKESTPAERG